MNQLSRTSVQGRRRIDVRVFGSAAVLLVVMTLSSAVIAADEGESNSCLCENTRNVVLAWRPATVNLPDSRTKSQNERWQPSVDGRDWEWIVIHHSATASGSVEAIHNEHQKRKDSAGNNWLGIGYHFVIGNGSGMEDGEIEATFRWKQQIHGAHSGSAVHNEFGIGICLIGDFQKQPPSKNQMESVIRLIRHLANHYQIAGESVIGHRTVKRTLCPGRFFPLQDAIRKSLGEGSRDR